MKKFALVGWLAAVVSLVFATAMGVHACRSYSPPDGTEAADASVATLTIGTSTGGARLLAANAPRLGANFVEAGVDSGVIPDGGSYITWTLSTPITPPFGDQPITGVELRATSLDLVAGTASFYVASVGGDVNKTRIVVVPLSAAQELSFTTSAKTAVANGLGVTFQ